MEARPRDRPRSPLTVVSDKLTPDDSALDDRKRRILRAIVTEHVARGEPVGSQRVVEIAQLDVSSATVRNDMAALEEMGFIHQPHTSAGRVPTDAGYRVFVDDLRRRPARTGPEHELVEELLGQSHDVEDLLVRTSSVLSQLTRLVSLVIAPAVDTSRLRLVELVSLSPRSALLLLVSDTGRVLKRVVELPAATSDADLDRVRTVLGEHVLGRMMREVPDAIQTIAGEAPSELRGILDALHEATVEETTTELVRRVYVGGQASLATEDAFEGDQLSRVLELLEERRTLARLLAEASEPDEPTVRIGAENDVEGLQSASLVAQRYELPTEGSLGVLGPTRMDYATVLATVRAVAAQLRQTLSDLSS